MGRVFSRSGRVLRLDQVGDVLVHRDRDDRDNRHRDPAGGTPRSLRQRIWRRGLPVVCPAWFHRRLSHMVVHQPPGVALHQFSDLLL